MFSSNEKCHACQPFTSILNMDGWLISKKNVLLGIEWNALLCTEMSCFARDRDCAQHPLKWDCVEVACNTMMKMYGVAWEMLIIPYVNN